jgi:hypothetical protein
MDLESFKIQHTNNTLEVYKKDILQFSSAWYSGFGKFYTDVFNSDKKIIYTVTKQFQFWKWRMVYHIKKDTKELSELISKNNKKTIFSIDVNEITYQIKIHFQSRLSIFKNDSKIAEFNEACTKDDFAGKVKLLLLDKNDLEIAFLMYSCLKIGEQNRSSKSIIASQKQLEPNDDPWS